MKQPLKPRQRPTAAEALAVAAQTAPSLPPAQMPPVADKAITMTMRLREATITALGAAARQRGMTVKQVVTSALADAGIAVAQVDLEDRTPRRRSQVPG